MFVVYNANGREIPSYDSQPARYTAMALAEHGTLRLDDVVRRLPPLADRPGFTRDRNGNFRSAYPLPSAFAAAIVARALAVTRLVDLRAPMAPNLVAKVTASGLTALAIAVAFLCARRRATPVQALWVAIALGLGTNMWASVSQTLWQQETALSALAVAVLALAATPLLPARAFAATVALALAGAARPQLAPTVAVLAASVLIRMGGRRSVLALIPLGIVATLVVAMNMRWFGHPLGAVPQLEALHQTVHGVRGTFTSDIAGGLLGLFFSPNRGLVIFSPVVLLVLGSIPDVIREGWTSDLRWCALAIAVQTLFYSAYTVWWGGHTFGPRYALDLLPAMIPLAAAAINRVLAVAALRLVAAGLICWSAVVAATGAFVYPADNWNNHPTNVDLTHERLWSWADLQIVRCWHTGPSPQNFSLFSRAAVTRPADDALPGLSRPAGPVR
jgi:hypothetical protein